MLYRKLKALLLTGIIAGCSTNPVSNSGSNTNELPFKESKSIMAQREMVMVTDPRISEQALSINKFAVQMYLQLIKESGNTFFSPYSITTALGMTDAGAKGATDEQIRKALQVTLAGDDFHCALNGLDQSLKTYSDATDGLELRVENSIWAQDNNFNLKVAFLDKLERHYGAGVYLLDFQNNPDPSRIIINDWVADKTNQRIQNLLPKGIITADTRLVLTNAIYFLADWLIKFDVTKTGDKEFHCLDGSSVTVPMMMLRDTTLKLLYKYSNNARVLELPYKGERIVMDFILPDSGKFSEFEQTLTEEVLKTLAGNFTRYDSVGLPSVRIPRFEFNTRSISLKKALSQLGMIAPFTGADFSGMSDINLKVSDVIHKAYIKVDEKGTEAAVATGVIMETTSTIPISSFVADRPFIYLIRDKVTNTILFMGRVLDPLVVSE